jgi:hypothetical protein
MAKKPTSKPSPGRSERRRQEVRRSLPRPAIQLRAVLTQAPVVRTTITVFLFLVLGTVLVIWSGDHVRVEPGQTMTHTRLNRLTFELVDQAATDAKVTNARQSAPYIYTINDPALQRLGASIGGLPAAVAGLSSIEDVAPDLTAAFPSWTTRRSRSSRQHQHRAAPCSRQTAGCRSLFRATRFR